VERIFTNQNISTFILSTLSVASNVGYMLRELCIILLLTVIGLAYSLVGGLSPQTGVETELQAGEIYLADAQALNAIWVDTRTLKEFEDSHLTGALFFDESDWDTGLSELMNTWLIQPRPIVIYCRGEDCETSKRVAERLRESLPDAEIYSLKGGSTAWQE
jgi:rhodanese-related sulfurtransferase